MQKTLDTVKFWKMMDIFEFLTLKLVSNRIQTFAKMYFTFFYYVGGGKVFEDFRKAIQF